jgi:hypothetical protein
VKQSDFQAVVQIQKPIEIIQTIQTELHYENPSASPESKLTAPEESDIVSNELPPFDLLCCDFLLAACVNFVERDFLEDIFQILKH